MGYTKGKWKIGEPFNKSGDEFPIYSVDGYELARVFIHNGEQFANANLISAAPAMYEALKSLLWDLRQHAIPNDLSEFEQALAQAEKEERR